MSVTFQIHPTDLQQRRKRCRPIVERLLKFERRVETDCNVCGSPAQAIISQQDRYGFPGRAAVCLHCGLVYNVDRFTPAGYSEFYKDGSYRELISQFKETEQTIERIHKAQINYAAGIIRTMTGFLPRQPGARLLDVGGSTGLVASEFQKHFGLKPVIIEPAADEVAKAKSIGVEAHVGSVEDWETKEQFDVILLCRTVEHLYDLRLALTKIRALLKPGGLFYCDIAEVEEICRREGPPEAITKIDHCFWLTPETAPGIFRALGFEIVQMHQTLPPDQAGFLLRACEPATKVEPVCQPWLLATLRLFREVSTDWFEFGRSPMNAKDWVRQRAYQVKRKLTE